MATGTAAWAQEFIQLLSAEVSPLTVKEEGFVLSPSGSRDAHAPACTKKSQGQGQGPATKLLSFQFDWMSFRVY